MLEFKQVSKSFRDGNQIIQAVKPTDLKIIQGELIAIVGPSGSGKVHFNYGWRLTTTYFRKYLHQQQKYINII